MAIFNRSAIFPQFTLTLKNSQKIFNQTDKNPQNLENPICERLLCSQIGSIVHPQRTWKKKKKIKTKLVNVYTATQHFFTYIAKSK
jgi:hypothetical protein